ncbi:MAG TPA: hypothetical protein VL309_05880 [Vicinamibacterales bacterium]|nr:hypothetical protein [Vicinamibacterales bacterium]
MILVRLALASLVAVAALSPGQPQPDIDPHLKSIVTSRFGFTSAELADLRRGKVIRRALESQAPGEIAVAGAVRIRAPKTTFMARVRDIVRFKRGPNVLQIGLFSDPPVVADLAALTVSRDDFDPADCRVSDCGIRIPAQVIDRVGREIDPSEPDAQARAAALFKQVLVDHVRAYLHGGPGRMVQFDDSSTPLRPMDQFHAILSASPVLAELAPGLPEHLTDPAAKPIPGAEDVVYWSKERFGMAPFITVTHAVLLCPSPAFCVIASRDVYSTRYVDASLSISVAADVPSDPALFDLVYENRSRATALKGMFGALRRSIAERRAKAGLEDTLKTLRQTLEQGQPADRWR